MEPPQKLFRNRPAPIKTFQATRVRKSKLESKFNNLYPDVQWRPRDLSVKFMIPFNVTKEFINDKPKLLKIIFDSLETK